MKTTTLTLGLLGLGAALLAVAGTAAALVQDKDVTVDTTWTTADSPVAIIGQVKVVNGATLTLSPGVQLRFDGGASMKIGSLSAYGDFRDKGYLNAVGTAAQPITFTSSSGVRTWNGMEIDARRGSPDKPIVLEHVVIEKSAAHGLLVRNHPGLALTDVTVRQNNGAGIWLENTVATLTRVLAEANQGTVLYANYAITARDTTFRLNDGLPVQVNAGSLLENVVYSQNGVKAIQLLSGTITSDRTWGIVSDVTTSDVLAYRLGAVTVRNEATLTLLPGVKLEFEPGGSLVIGTCCADVRDRGALVAEGTVTQPITLTSRTTLRDWSGVEIDGRATSVRMQSRLSNVEIEKTNTRGITIRSHNNVVMAGVESSGNAGNGFEFIGTPGTYANLVAAGNGGQGFYVVDASPTLVNAISRSNGQHGFYLWNSWAVLRDVTATSNRYGIFTDYYNANAQVYGATLEANRERPARLNMPGPWNNLVLRGNGIREIETWGMTTYASRTLLAIADETDGRLHDYVFLQDTHFRNGATLTIEPGLTLKFANGAGLYIGSCCSYSESANLIADGTEAAPIVFRSWSGNRDWQGIRVDARGRYMAPILDNVRVENSNGDGLELYGVTSAARVTNVRVTNARSDGIYLYDASPRLEGVTVSDSGRWGIRWGGSGSPTLADVTVLRSGGTGIYGDYNVRPTFTNVVIERSGSFPLRTAIGTDLSTTTFRANAVDVIEFYGSPITSDYTVARAYEADTGNLHVVQFRYPSFSVYNGATLTFEQGLTVRLGDDVYVYAGTCCAMTRYDLGAIRAIGTSDEQIRFTSVSRLDRWGGLYFDGRSLAGELASVFENVTIEQANGPAITALHHDSITVKNAAFQFNNLGMLVQGSDVDVRDSRFQFNRGSGVSVSRWTSSWYGEDGWSRSRFQDNLFRENNGYGLWSEAGSMTNAIENVFANNTNAGLTIDVNAFDDDNQFTLNGGGILELSGGTLTHDLTFGLLRDSNVGTPIPYTILGDVTVSNGATLSVDPGVPVRFAGGAGLFVGTCCEPNWRGSLTAIGEDGEPVTFRSWANRQDWDGVFIRGNGPDALPSTLRHVTIERAAGPGLTVESNARVTIEHLLFRDNSNGIRLAGSSPALVDVDVLRSTGSGIVLESASPRMTDVLVSQSAGFGIDGDAGARPQFVDVRIERGASKPLRTAIGTDFSGLVLKNNAAYEADLWGSTVSNDALIPGLRDADNGRAVRYLVLSDVTVRDDATLTLGPGSTLGFYGNRVCSWWGCTDYFYGMRIGTGAGYRDHGRLLALGTPSEPVTLTGTNGPGTWNGLSLYGAPGHLVESSVLRNVVIENSRYNGFYAEDHNDLTIENVVARANSYAGGYLVRTPAEVTNSAFRANGGSGLVIASSAAKVLAPAFESNAGGGLHVIAASPTVADAVFRQNGASAIHLEGTPAITFGAVKLDRNAFDVSLLNTGEKATFPWFAALGAPAVRAEFTSEQGTAGAWNRVGLRAADPHHLRADFTGGQGGFLTTRLVPVFDNAEFNFTAFAPDGTVTQRDRLRTDGESGLAWRVALNGARKAVLDVIPVVQVDFDWTPVKPTIVDDVRFTDATRLRFTTITGHEWRFGDGSTSTEASPVKRYAKPLGEKVVTHCVTIDANDLKYCAPKILEVVNHLPIPRFTPSIPNPMMMEEITFTGASVDPDGFVIRVGWEFGDNVRNNVVPDVKAGSTAVFVSGSNVALRPAAANDAVKHRYQWPGHYLLNLTVEDDLFGRSVLQQEIWVRTPAERAAETVQDGIDRVEAVAGEVRAEADAAVATVQALVNERMREVGGIVSENETEARATFRDLVSEVDVEPAGLLCMEAALGLTPVTGPIATCVSGVILRNAGELDLVMGEIEHEIARTDVPPPFLQDEVDTVTAMIPAAPTPPDPQAIVENPPSVDPNDPPTIEDLLGDEPPAPPSPPPIPDPTNPQVPTIDVPDTPGIPATPNLPNVTRVCYEGWCVPWW